MLMYSIFLFDLMIYRFHVCVYFLTLWFGLLLNFSFHNFPCAFPHFLNFQANTPTTPPSLASRCLCLIPPLHPPWEPDLWPSPFTLLCELITGLSVKLQRPPLPPPPLGSAVRVASGTYRRGKQRDKFLRKETGSVWEWERVQNNSM